MHKQDKAILCCYVNVYETSFYFYSSHCCNACNSECLFILVFMYLLGYLKTMEAFFKKKYFGAYSEYT